MTGTNEQTVVAYAQRLREAGRVREDGSVARRDLLDVIKRAGSNGNAQLVFAQLLDVGTFIEHPTETDFLLVGANINRHANEGAIKVDATPKPPTETLAERCKAFRERHGFTAAKMGNVCRVSGQSISNVEAGKSVSDWIKHRVEDVLSGRVRLDGVGEDAPRFDATTQQFVELVVASANQGKVLADLLVAIFDRMPMDEEARCAYAKDALEELLENTAVDGRLPILLELLALTKRPKPLPAR